MNDNIVSASGKAFQKFISHLTQQLTRPKAFVPRGLSYERLQPAGDIAYRPGGRGFRDGLANP